MDIDFLFKPFKKKTSERQLFAYWLVFFVLGAGLMFTSCIFLPAYCETSEEVSVGTCKPYRLFEIGMAVLLETGFFFILPWKWKGMKGAFVGILSWIILHAISMDVSVAIYIAIVGYFYYRCLEIGRWKQLFLYHMIPNSIVIVSCLL